MGADIGGLAAQEKVQGSTGIAQKCIPSKGGVQVGQDPFANDIFIHAATSRRMVSILKRSRSSNADFAIMSFSNRMDPVKRLVR